MRKTNPGEIVEYEHENNKNEFPKLVFLLFRVANKILFYVFSTFTPWVSFRSFRRFSDLRGHRA